MIAESLTSDPGISCHSRLRTRIHEAHLPIAIMLQCGSFWIENKICQLQTSHGGTVGVVCCVGYWSNRVTMPDTAGAFATRLY